MPDASTLALFAAAALALACTPGPDMLLILSRSVAQGRGAGFASLFGAQAGIYCHAAAVALGLSELFRAVPLAYDAVRYAGAAYLLYLAWGAFRSRGSALTPDRAARRLPLTAVFRQGVLTNILNPKVALFALALFPQFVRPEAGPVAAQIMVLATVLNLIGLLVNGSIVLGASRLARAAAGRVRFRRAPGIALGTVFTGLALRLAVDR
ncbi:LysE family translocator [Lichenibacterium dinghuense]|uniref:LysE family translocator n=1 Tax=Lichenibacterium dinghuense TaxID=2895977 RepID=UPI001F48D849|nr:LysE family translocator [Lichenibacterium sp. 6Y81]